MIFINPVENLTEGSSDPFQSDSYRCQLAKSRSLDLLSRSYLPGVLPELPDLSSQALWTDMAHYEGAPEFRLRRLRQVVNGLPEKGKVLDIGSGWGEIIPMVQESPDREYVAMDFSKEMLQRLREKYPSVRTIHGSINDVNEEFDVIMALEVCEHIPATKILQFYSDVRSRLASDGRFFVTVPLYENLKAQTLTCPQCHHMHNRMGHVRSYTPELIRKELELGGFEILETQYVYHNFDGTIKGVTKRVLLNFARKLFGLGKFMPLNVVLIARAKV